MRAPAQGQQLVVSPRVALVALPGVEDGPAHRCGLVGLGGGPGRAPGDKAEHEAQRNARSGRAGASGHRAPRAGRCRRPGQWYLTA